MFPFINKDNFMPFFSFSKLLCPDWLESRVYGCSLPGCSTSQSKSIHRACTSHLSLKAAVVSIFTSRRRKDVDYYRGN